MTTVEKRRSSRKSGSRRKRRDRGYSGTCSGGSFLDETDREVSSLTDKAFRSLCIGDEAVYNDSELSLSSPCSQRERQLAFGQSVQDREREELKKYAQENLSLRVQEYEEQWIQGGMDSADINNDPQREFYGERKKGSISATFQHSFVETSEREKSLREDQLSYFSNGVTEVNSQQFRSRSRVSSLIRAFNSEGCRDLTAVEDKLRECNNETSWDKSALMSIQQELHEFSSPYQHTFNSGHFPITGPFSSQNTNFYSSEVAAMAHMSPNSAASLMRSSHSKLSMSAQMSNCNFFIHSEFSPFKVWRDHNRFPFKHGQISGFVPYPDFHKWYETPMYKELCMQNHPQDPYRGVYHSHLAPVPSTPPRSTSTSTMLQKASSLEKRCESELAGHCPNWKRTQILGNNRLPSQRPSTASPTSEMSRRVRDTISSVKALQQKIKRITGQEVTTGMMTNPQVEVYGNNNLTNSADPYDNRMVIAQNVVRSSTSPNPFKSNQLPMPLANTPQEAATSDMLMDEVSPVPMEHPPVRAESRGGDVRSSSYKSRAISLLFNLKDNRKRVKNTYSPTKFKGLEVQEQNQPQAVHETVIDIPETPNQDNQYSQLEDCSRTNVHNQHANMYESSGLSVPMQNSQPLLVNAAHYPEYTSETYQTGQVPGFSGYTSELMPENYAGSQLANGQHFINDFASFTAYKQEQFYDKVTLGADSYGPNQCDTSTEVSNLNIESDPSQRYFFNNTNVQAFNEPAGGAFSKVNRYEQFKHNKLNYTDVSSQEQMNTQESVKAHISAWKPEATALMENTRQRNHSSICKERENQDHFEIDRISFDISSQQPQYMNQSNTVENPAYYGQQPFVTSKENRFQKYSGPEMIDNYLSKSDNTYSNEKYRHQNVHSPAKVFTEQNMGQINVNTPTPKKNDLQSLHLEVAKPPLEQNVPSQSEDLSACALTNQRLDRSLVEVKAEHVYAENAQAELPKTQQWSRVEQPKTDLNGLIIAESTCSGNVIVEQAQAAAAAALKENVKPATTEHTEKVKRIGEQAEQPDDKAASITEHYKVEKITDQPIIITEEAGVEKERQSMGSVKIKQTDTEQTEQASIKQVQSEDPRNSVNRVPWNEPVSVEKDDSSEVKQVKSENINEKPKEVSRKAEQHKVKVAENEVAEVANAMKDDYQTSIHQNLVKLNFLNLEQCTSQANTKKETKLGEIKSDMGKYKTSKVEQCIFKLEKGEDLQEKSAKLTAKVKGTQQVKVERDKVEQVKTELAKAKAELAKIKEKMRGEHREKLKNMMPINAKSVDSSTVNVNTNDTSKKQIQPLQVFQQREHAVIKNVQPDRGADDYDRLREKYGYINAGSNRTKTGLLPIEKASSDENHETKPLDKTGIVNKERSKEHISRLARTNTTIKETDCLEAAGEADNQYIYSESSKEFKLWSSNDPTTQVDKSTVPDKVNEFINSEKCDPMKPSDVSHQNNASVNKLLPLETKNKLTEHNSGPAKDQHFTPLRGLSNKDKAQIKQDILTSKIKAHAEKEISAIKEKGFLLRDGSKGSAKQILGIQSVNVRQRPPQEVAQKNENIISSNTTLKGHTETSAVQLEPITSVLSSCSNMSVKTSSTRAEDLLLGKGNKKPIKSNQDLPEIPSKAKPTATNTTESHYENQDNPPEKSLSIPNNEQTHQADQGKHRAQSCDLSEKLKTEPKETSAQVVACVNDKFEKSLEISAESTKENTQSKDTDHEDSAPSLNLLLGQKQSLGTDDSLHIMGIMVTVRERNAFEDTVQENSCPLKPEKIEVGRCHPSSSQQVEKETTFSKENSTEKTKFVQESHLKADDKQAKTGKKPETEEQTSSLVLNEKFTIQNVQSDCSSLNAKPRTETQSELQAEKGVAVTLHAKNKVLAETQPLSYGQSISSSETKEYQENKSKGKDKVRTEEENLEKLQKTFCTENIHSSAVISKINNKDIVDTQTRPEAQSSEKEDLTNDVNHFKIRSKEDNSASRLDGKRHQSPSPKTLNQVGMSPSLTDTILNTGENNPENNDVHIDCIAIRVMPMASNNDIFEVKKKQQSITSPLDSNQSEPNPLASTSYEEKGTTLLIKGQCRDVVQPNSEEKVGDNLEHNAGTKSAKCNEGEASKLLQIHNLQSRNITTIKNTGVNDETTKRVNKNEKASDNVNEHAIEGGYFQLQELTETNDELLINPATVDHSKNKRVSPHVPLHTEKQYKEQIHEAFLFKVDEDKRISMKSSRVSIQDEGAKVGILENTSAKLPTKLNDGTTAGLSQACDGVEADQASFMRKSPTETESALTGSDKPSSRDSYLNRERRIKEKTDNKTRPKERTSAIPEISALADYARLKVIVSEDNDLNPIQEFPPNKKEGFFPLIHTRHSRRPVFTTDTLEHSVKEKTQRNNTEMSAKVNKEPKAIIYPITVKEHQRTGMFKLGDKERQSSSAGINNSASEQNITADTKTGQQVNDSKTLQTRSSSSAVNRLRNTPEGFVYLDKTSSQYPTNREMSDRKETKSSSRSRNLDTQSHKELESEPGDRADEHTIQGLLIQAENTPAKQESKLKPLNKELVFSNIEESGGHLAEEVRSVIQGEEEKQGRRLEMAVSPIKNDSGTQIKEIITGKRSEGGKKRTENEQKQKTEKTQATLTENKEQRRGRLSEESLEERERADEKEQPRSLREEQQRRAAKEEQHSKATQDEPNSRLASNRGAVLLQQQRKAAQEEQQRKAAHQEQQRKVRQEDKERKVAQEDQKRNTAQEKHQSTAVHQRGAALIEQQKIAAQEEQQRKAAREEQSRAALQEQYRRATQDELQRKAAQEEQQRKAALEWHERNVQKKTEIGHAQQEQQRIVAQEEQQKKAAQEELQKTEHRRIALQQEMQERAAQKEQHRSAAWEGQQSNALQDDHQRKAAQTEQQQKSREEQVQKAAREMQQNHTDEKLPRRAALEEQRRKTLQEEQQSRSAQEKQQRKGSNEVKQRELLEEQSQSTLTNEKIISYDDDDKCKEKLKDDGKVAGIRKENTSTQMQEKIKTDTQTQNLLEDGHKKEESIKAQGEEAKKGKTEKGEETQAQELMTRVLEKSDGALKEEKRIAPETMSIQKDDEIKAEKREEQKKTSAHTERQQASQIEKQRIIAQMDALQYYAITSPEPEKKSRERQLFSPLQSQRRCNSSRLEQIDRSHRPQGPASLSPSLPRSTTSSPALGVKPSMFRVKDNTFKSSTFTKSVKPRFHKNFGEDIWGSQLDIESEKGDDEQAMQRNTGIPIHSDTGLLRHTALNNTSSQGSLPPISYQRPYSRRSVAFDEDDTRSVISTMSEDVESYATSAADLADIRGLYDYERPESACSFSSDVSRSSGRPPTVPPKSEKALRRAQRLTCRRIKKELSKVIENSSKEVQREDTINPPSTITEVRSSNCDAVASPHFSPPLSLAHAPTVGSSLPSSHTKQHSIKRLFHASSSPHATAPISLPNSSAHAIASVSLPAAPKTVAHVPSSPILRHAIHAAPVTQYQVESRYHPLTQRKVLQDLGSGQYFVVDVPVEVKTKTFIDPETGKYVQLNVRESRQSVSQPKPQQLCPQVQLQPQIQINKHQQTVSHASKPAAFHNGYQNHPQSYELAAINSIVPKSTIQGHLSANESQRHPALQAGQSNDGHRYSPEKTPYMDTVNDADKSLNTVQGTHGSFPESDTNNQLTGCSVIGNDNSLQSQCLPCNIITMGELDDFMEVSDW